MRATLILTLIFLIISQPSWSFEVYRYPVRFDPSLESELLEQFNYSVNVVFRRNFDPDLNGFPDDLEFDQNRMPHNKACLLYTSPSPRDATLSRMPSSA